MIELHEKGRMESRSAKDIWEAALGELQVQVSKSNYKTWLEKTTGLRYENDQFTIGVPNVFIAEYLNRNQRSLIEKTLINFTHRHSKVVFQVGTDYQTYKAYAASYGNQETITFASSNGSQMLNPNYTFKTFVVGEGNNLAYSAACRVATHPGQDYNPLFIYGGPGLGKTHLLQATGHSALANSYRVLYVSAEQFTNDFVKSLRHGEADEFRDKYRSADVLLVDDIQFISNKERTEESFFHVFNDLHNANRQIVVTCDCPPKSLPQLQDRLRSRFEWGLVADIQPPNLETRLAILQTKVKRQDISVAPDVLEFIAQQAKQNIRELEGSLNRVIAYAKILRSALTPELALKALESVGSKAVRSEPVMPELIIKAVAAGFQITTEDLLGRKRDKETAMARRVAMYLMRQETSCSLAQIGTTLGNRDHSAVISGCQKVAAEIEVSAYLKRKVTEIRQKLHCQQ